ncbi:MAG TPA: MerR family transcriptional regulator [Mycobacteriales bacterium]|jgi:DNA-binding transcriptional MerR regulator|nr:MerR family transcriptional regulator [Mycobacteriales bacterium]
MHAVDDRSLPFFTVSQVASMLDVQQPFLRRLEAHDLVTPGRTEGNQRRYSHDDVERVSHIVSLVGEGLTLAGVKRVLELQAEVTALRAELAELRRRSGRRR